MITYNLACAKGHEFEGWFKDSATYDFQEADGSLACPTCGDIHVKKAIMAPSVMTSVTKAKGNTPDLPAAPIDQQKLRQFVAEAKFERLPLKFYDSRTRGAVITVLSTVTLLLPELPVLPVKFARRYRVVAEVKVIDTALLLVGTKL